MERRSGQTVGDRYRLERLLATGGMGAVWVARHVELDVEVALKFVATGEVEEDRAFARFRREARAAASLASEHIVRVHDFGLDEGAPFLAMELLRGEDLLQHLEREGPLAPGRVAALVRQTCQGLQVAHQAGVVHRDLKPSNLFLAQVGQGEVVKILDFGVAKQSSPTGPEPTTGVGVLLGTPAYMSPEQARARAVDHRTDLWALGAIAFEMLTGTRAFEGATLSDTVARICSDPPPKPGDRTPDLERFDEFFRRAFERDPANRFHSADELADAFEAAAAATLPAPAVPRARPGREARTVTLVTDAPTLEPVLTTPPRADGASKGRLGGATARALVALMVASSLAAVGWMATERRGRDAAGEAAPVVPSELVAPAPTTSAGAAAPFAAATPRTAAAAREPTAPAKPPSRARAPAARPGAAAAKRAPGAEEKPSASPPPPAAAADPVFGLPATQR